MWKLKDSPTHVSRAPSVESALLYSHEKGTSTQHLGRGEKGRERREEGREGERKEGERGRRSKQRREEGGGRGEGGGGGDRERMGEG